MKEIRGRPRRNVHIEEPSFEESRRPTRSTRYLPSSSRNNDSDEDSDDDQLLSMIARQNQSKRSPRGAVTATATATTPPISTEFVDTTSPVHQNGTSLPRTREMIRRKQTTITTNTATPVATANQGNYHSTRSITETTSQIEIRRNQVRNKSYFANNILCYTFTKN